MAHTWKMCNLGHWYRNEPCCPICTKADRSETDARPRAYPMPMVVPAI